VDSLPIPYMGGELRCIIKVINWRSKRSTLLIHGRFMLRFKPQQTSHQKCTREGDIFFHPSVSHGDGQLFGRADKSKTSTITVSILNISFMDWTRLISPLHYSQSLYYNQGFCWYQSVLEALLLLTFIFNSPQNPFLLMGLETPMIIAGIMFFPRLFLCDSEAYGYIYTFRSFLSLISFVLLNLQLLLIIDIGYISAILLHFVSCILSILEIGLFLRNRHLKGSTSIGWDCCFVFRVALYALTNEVIAILFAVLMDFPGKFPIWIIAFFFILPRFITSVSNFSLMGKENPSCLDRFRFFLFLSILCSDMVSAFLLTITTNAQFLIYAFVVKLIGLIGALFSFFALL
jgi:hypothetical protein